LRAGLVRVEEAFKNLKGDLAIRPIFHSRPGPDREARHNAIDDVASLPRIPAAGAYTGFGGSGGGFFNAAARWRMYSNDPRSASARRGGRSSPRPAHRPGLVRIPQLTVKIRRERALLILKCRKRADVGECGPARKAPPPVQL